MIKFLAIDDNINNLMALEALLSEAYPESITIKAQNGEDGIKNAISELPDVIFLDILMPLMDGYQVCSQIRDDNRIKYIPILMLTAAGDDKYIRIKALQAGADAFISKPVGESELRAQVAAMLRIKKSEEELRGEREMLSKLVNERTKQLQQKLREQRKTENKLRHTLIKLESSRISSLNLMEDLRDEIEIRKSKEIEIERSREQLEKLNLYLQKIREEERRLIARELHDELGQELTAVKIDLASLKSSVDDKMDFKIKIDKISSLVSDSIGTVKRLTSELRPHILEDLGLIAAIEWYTSEFITRTGINTKLNIDKDIELDKELEFVIFRIMQESFTNIARHSKAESASIFFSQRKRSILLEIEDDGIGLSEINQKSAKSFGLFIMKERAREIGGTLVIESVSGHGTTIRLSVPNVSKK
jgi:signal transduction histidine kinase